MHPLVRLWALCATCVALLLALRGAWALALACFLLSPAPAWVLAQGSADARHVSATWLAGIAIVVVLAAALFVAIVSMGGLPPVHEWRGALAGAAR
jgi:hypothetical protein